MNEFAKKVVIACAAMCWMAGCRSKPVAAPPQHVVAVVKPQTKPAPPTPIAVKKVELGEDSWDPAWDLVIEKSLPKRMVWSRRAARDVRPYCPRFGELREADRRAFWAYFFQALAGAEAGLKPTTDIRHTEPAVDVVDTVTKRKVRSEGLLQLTYMDADRYGCDFDWDVDHKLREHDPEKTILQPENNLKCGIRILDNQLFVLHRPLLSGLSYWSTLQPGTVSHRVFRKQMANVPAVCRVDPEREEARGKRKPAGTAVAAGGTE